MSLEHRVLSRIRRWWRPVTAVWICLTMLVNGVFLPLARWFATGEADTDLMGLSALVTATAGAFAVREWGKIKGSSDAD